MIYDTQTRRGRKDIGKRETENWVRLVSCLCMTTVYLVFIIIEPQPPASRAQIKHAQCSVERTGYWMRVACPLPRVAEAPTPHSGVAGEPCLRTTGPDGPTFQVYKPHFVGSLIDRCTAMHSDSHSIRADGDHQFGLLIHAS
jgi:hypothetical protein